MIFPWKHMKTPAFIDDVLQDFPIKKPAISPGFFAFSPFRPPPGDALAEDTVLMIQRAISGEALAKRAEEAMAFAGEFFSTHDGSMVLVYMGNFL